ncbi:MAG: UvrD-helicase domain-containing protein, partial [Spirochaetales bacterium]
MSRIYTPEQIDVINEKSSCVVSAGAGSGKTSVLSERFLRHVKDGTPCNKILTITFTRKAAMEMRGRIRGLLVENSLSDQIAIFHSAKICTVDSFCQEIVRKGSRKYGIPGNFRVASSRELNTAARQIATDLLTQQAKGPAAHYLLSLTDPSAVVSFLCSITKETNIVHPLFTDNTYNLVIELAKTTRINTLQSIEEDVLRFKDLFSCEPSLVPDIEIALRGLENLKVGIPFFREGEQFSGKYGSKENRSTVTDLKRQIKENVNKLILCNNTIENEENIKAMYSLIALFEEQVNNYKRSAGILTFQDCMK